MAVDRTRLPDERQHPGHPA